MLDLTDLPAEPLGYTEEEFRETVDSEKPVIKELMKTAIKAYVRLGII